MKLLKSKKFLIVLAVFLVIVTGYRLFGGNESKLEKQLIATLPCEITQCYFQGSHAISYSETESVFGFSDYEDRILNNFEVKKLTVERQTTNDNVKNADCVIELENENFERIVYAHLICIKYDDGSWQVQSWYENSDTKMIPKYMPKEDEGDVKTYIAKSRGYTNLAEIEKNLDFENGKIAYRYSVNDSFEYFRFDGEISFEQILKNREYEGLDCYYWDYDIHDNTEITWDILGTWLIECDEPYDGTDLVSVEKITITEISEENAGTSKYKTPLNFGSHYGYSAEQSGKVRCFVYATNVFDAECRIIGEQARIIITHDGAEAEMRWNSASLTKV